MQNIIPTFKTKNNTYEIKINRIIQAKFDDFVKEAQGDTSSQRNVSIAHNKTQELQEITEKYRTAKEQYFDDITNEDKKNKYKAFKALYEEQFDDYTRYESETNAMTNAINGVVNAIENVLIYALTQQYKLDEITAKNEWCEYVDSVGKESAREWLMYMYDFIKGEDKGESDPFLSQMRARKEKEIENSNSRKNFIAKKK